MALAGLCFYNVYQAALTLQRDGQNGAHLLSRIGMQVMQNAVSVYVPGLLYAEETETSQEILEDESTCESILEMNGRTLAERLLEENQEDAVSQENEAAQEEQQQDGQEEAAAQTVTPQFDISLERLRDFE